MQLPFLNFHNTVVVPVEVVSMQFLNIISAKEMEINK